MMDLTLALNALFEAHDQHAAKPFHYLNVVSAIRENDVPKQAKAVAENVIGLWARGLDEISDYTRLKGRDR